MDSEFTNQVSKTMQAPAKYFAFDEFTFGSEARKALQISSDWSNARLKGEFNTLQIIDDITVPKEFGGAGVNLEPITHSYPEFGSGGFRQAYSSKTINFDRISLMKD